MIWNKLKRLKESETALAALLIIGGSAGLKASFALTLDKIMSLQNPGFVPSCNINPIISCGTVMNTPEAAALGVLNSLLGLVAFGAVITVGVSILAGAKYKKWFWQLFNLGTLGGVLFVHWLYYESIYKINAICPWCTLVWVVTISMFWYVTLYNLESGNIKTPKPLTRVVKFAQTYKHAILLLWLMLLAGSTIWHFWYYFKTIL